MSIKKSRGVVKSPYSNLDVLPYNRMKKILFIFVTSLFLGGCTVKDLFVKPSSGLEIYTTPTATVFIDDQNKGQTPFTDKNIKPGNYTIKLVPVSGDNLAPYETKLELVSKASTVISRSFAPSELDISGYTLQLQEDPSGETYLSIISEPDTINVTIDDKPSGFTPLSKLATTPGSHSLVVSSPGYIEQSLAVNAVKGYNLIINFKLASQTITLTPPTPATDSASTPVAPITDTTTSKASPSATPKLSVGTTPASEIAKPYVVIGDTGTGWLRVRQEASGTSAELGKADTGEKLKYLGESTEVGWFKVEFEGAIGWVSGKYVTLVK